MKPTKTFLMTAAAVAVLSTGALADNYTNDATSDTSMHNESRSVGTSDAGAMNSSASADVTANVEPAAGAADEADISAVQASLRNEGYSISADGVWGPQTAEAVRQFQQANGLSATGQLDTQTLAALDINKGTNR